LISTAFPVRDDLLLEHLLTHFLLQ
jgi:hypothetical protein